MTHSSAASRGEANRALFLALGAAALAWLLFLAGQYVGLLLDADSSWEYGDPERLRPSEYFTVAAVAVLGLGALIAKRRLARLRSSSAPRSALVEPVSRFSTILLIVAAVLAAWAVFVIFMSGFFAGDQQTEPLVRLLNVYAPIVLYTALVVTLILAGFVFLPPVAAEARAEPVPSDALAETGSERSRSQRATALAYAVPIVAAAIALLLGLIVYDFTRTALQVWIWVIIVAIVGFGVLVGSLLSHRGPASGEPVPGVVVGARTLNFVLSILFAVSVTGMSLGYGMSAVQALNVSPSLSLSAYSESEKFGDAAGVEMTDPQLSLWGSDLERGSEATVAVEPGGETVISARVDRQKWLNGEGRLPESLSSGDYELVAHATASDGAPVEVSLPFSVDDDGSVRFPEGSVADSQLEKSRLLPITGGWVLEEGLPAGVLLALGITLVAATLTSRNRDRSANG